MRLEDLRGGHVGDVTLWLGGGAGFPATFHHHAQAANWHTVNSLLRFAGQDVDAAVDHQIGIVEWWRTVESLVSLLTWLANVEDKAGLRPGGSVPPPQMDADVLTRWSGISRWFSDGSHSADKWLTGAVSELRDFRNSLEHAARSSSRARRHSRLSALPVVSNLADLMEAMAICICASHFVQSVVPDVDLMPQVLVPSREHAFFEPLDTVAIALLFPLYQRTLGARGLTSDVELYPPPERLRGHAVIQARMLIRFSDEHDQPPLNSQIDPWNEFEQWASSRPDVPSPGQFRLPGYSHSNFEVRTIPRHP